jgi:hypothetical protein
MAILNDDAIPTPATIRGPSPRAAQLFGAWCGPVFVILYLIGFVPLAHFLPAPSPSESAADIAKMYSDNAFGIRVGMVLDVIAGAFIAPWGAIIAARVRKHETGVPALSYALVACAGIGSLIAILLPLVWGLAAFRPQQIDPGITQMLNDAGWYILLFTFTIFTLWCIIIALATFLDRSQTPAFPRWCAYVNVWCGLLLFPAAMILFFKTGPLAYNGILALYVPLLAFFGWMVAVTYVMVRDIRQEYPANTGAN